MKTNLWDKLQKRMLSFSGRIAFSDEGLTYKELVNTALEKASGIQGAGRLIAASGATFFEQAINILAILASGNVAVPVTTHYGEKYFKKVHSIIESDNKSYEDLAFIMFTSGTTGTPKGVMLTHSNIVSNLKGIQSYFPVRETDRILISRPLVHIAVLTGELLYGLWQGAEISFFGQPFNAGRLASTIGESGATVFCSTPTMFMHLARYADEKAFSKLRLCVTSGERLTEQAADEIKKTFPFCDFFNVYGLTENSPRVSFLSPEFYATKPGSAGVPLPDTELKIVNGELLVRSPSVMKGYYMQPELTEEKLRGGWLHTGDAARQDNDGFYCILGRKDDMIIRAGMNVYPQEIEAELVGMPGITACRAYGEEDGRFGQRI
ncbi:MAG: class I adenylate-forming enzyme family protein, partial [Christensenellales bacterium]